MAGLLRLDEGHACNYRRLNEGEERRLEVFITRMRRAPDPRLETYIADAGFLHVSRIIGGAKLDVNLINALVERWRPETHTFHLPCGEATITLEDVSHILGLSVDGDAITGPVNDDWHGLCMELLGVAPDKFEGGCVYLRWLRENFSNLPDDANEDVQKAYARAHILQIIGGILVADKTRNKVHMLWLRHLRDFKDAGKLSWGSAVLAYLYRELCKTSRADKCDIGGCLLLLQAWAWFRMPFLCPDLSVPTGYTYPLCLRWCNPLTHVGRPKCMMAIRQDIENKSPNEFLWTPYSDPEIHHCLPPFSSETQSAWTAMVPLIWYAVVEWHPVDRVQRQFSRLQTIPVEPPNLDQLHRITRQGKLEVDWSVRHVDYIVQWQERHIRQAQNEYRMFDESMVTDDYFSWYFGHGKPFLLTPEEQAVVVEPVQRNRPRTHRTMGAGGSQHRRNASASRARGAAAGTDSIRPQPTDLFHPQPPTQLMLQPRPPSSTEGFFTPFVGQSYESFTGMMGGTSMSSVRSAFVQVYPIHAMPHDISGFGFIQQRPPQSLFFCSGPAGPSGTARDDDDNDNDDDLQPIVAQHGRRNPGQTRRPPGSGTGRQRQ